MSKSTTHPRRIKPAKPYPEFPLTPNGNGQWSKVVRGRTYYFGKWEDPDAALALFKSQVDDLQAGRTPRPKTDQLTVRDIANAYMEVQENKLLKGKIAPRTYADCQDRCQRLVSFLGHLVAEEVGPRDFTRLRQSYPATWGPVSEKHHIRLTRTVFKFAKSQQLISHAVEFGDEFKAPSRDEIRKTGRRRKMFTAAEVRKILTHLDGHDKQTQLRAMVLLGINCGFGNRDCAVLTEDMLIHGWIRTTRPKTGVERDCPLWQETQQAIEKVLTLRKRTTGEGHVFVTSHGNPWFTDKHRKDPVSQAFYRVVQDLGIGGSFYCLRHTFQTVCDQAGIPRYVSQRLMGHIGETISDNYSHGVTDDQLYDAVMKVHDWLYPLVRGGEA